MKKSPYIYNCVGFHPVYTPNKQGFLHRPLEGIPKCQLERPYVGHENADPHLLTPLQFCWQVSLFRETEMAANAWFVFVVQIGKDTRILFVYIQYTYLNISHHMWKKE